MTKILFLDDIRNPPACTLDTYIAVRSVEEAINYCEENGCPEKISFDHDLGNEDPTGYDFVKWIVEKDLDNPGWIPDNFSWTVHSMNPVGRENIEKLLIKYLEER